MAEDTVSYWIYPAAAGTDLDELLAACVAEAAAEASRYLWHHDRFGLRKGDGCLEGEVRYGENVEDEWFAVALLSKITRRRTDVVARVTDGDGEVLLIEAADCAGMPDWAQEPESAEGRVFLHRGRVHLVPVAEKPSQLNPFASSVADVDPARAAAVVADPSFATEASAGVQECISNRTKGYPTKWDENLHYAHCVLPARAARILHQNPQTLSTVTHRLMSMDGRDAKASRKMAEFPQSGSVRTGVQLTKCLFAMLDSRNLWPAKGSGWSLPGRGEESHREVALGYKIAAGMEMLLADAARRGIEGVEDDQSFQEYVERLTRLGYFRDLLPGSKEHTSLLREARCSFRAAEKDSDAAEDAALKEFVECAQSAEEFSAEEEAAREEKLRRPADSEDWLTMDRAEFDEMLKRQFGTVGEEGESASVMGKLGKFLDAESDMKGVEVEQVDDLDRPMEFDVDDLQESMKKILEALGSADGVGEDEDDQGKEEDDDQEVEDYLRWKMEDELLSSKVKEGTELVNSVKNLTSELNTMATGPAKTLLQTLNKAKK